MKKRQLSVQQQLTVSATAAPNRKQKIFLKEWGKRI